MEIRVMLMTAGQLVHYAVAMARPSLCKQHNRQSLRKENAGGCFAVLLQHVLEPGIGRGMRRNAAIASNIFPYDAVLLMQKI
jgi:hypothetical protein